MQIWIMLDMYRLNNRSLNYIAFIYMIILNTCLEVKMSYMNKIMIKILKTIYEM